MKADGLGEKHPAFFAANARVRRPSEGPLPRWAPAVPFTPAGMDWLNDRFLTPQQVGVCPIGSASWYGELLEGVRRLIAVAGDGVSG
jgi:hypothetical protein